MQGQNERRAALREYLARHYPGYRLVRENPREGVLVLEQSRELHGRTVYTKTKVSIPAQFTGKENDMETKDRPLDAPGTSKELRAFVDAMFGKDWRVVMLGLTLMLLESPKRGMHRLYIPPELRLTPVAIEEAQAQLEQQKTAQAKAAQEATA